MSPDTADQVRHKENGRFISLSQGSFFAPLVQGCLNFLSYVNLKD